MEDNMIILLIVTLLCFISILGFIILANYYFPVSCDIGKPEIAGDYIAHGWVQIIPSNICAVQDCSEFNKVNNETVCVA